MRGGPGYLNICPKYRIPDADFSDAAFQKPERLIGHIVRMQFEADAFSNDKCLAKHQ